LMLNQVLQQVTGVEGLPATPSQYMEVLAGVFLGISIAAIIQVLLINFLWLFHGKRVMGKKLEKRPPLVLEVLLFEVRAMAGGPEGVSVLRLGVVLQRARGEVQVQFAGLHHVHRDL